MVQRAHKFLCERQRQHGVTQQAEARRGRCHETRAFAGLVHNLAGRCHALVRIAVQQRQRCLALHHGGQLPGQVLRVLEGRVGTAHPKNRQQVGGVTGKQHSPVAVMGQRQGAGRIHAGPVQLPRQPAMANPFQLGVDATPQRLGPQGFFGGFACTQLVIDTPHVKRLAVHQHRVVRVPGRVKKSQALSGQRQLDADVGNHKTAFVAAAFQLQIQAAADEGAGPVAGHHVERMLGVGAAGGVHVKPGGFAFCRAIHRPCTHAHHLVAPAHFNQGLPGHLLQQGLFHILLLQVVERRKTVLRAVRVLHTEHPLPPVKRIAKTPGQAVAGDSLAGPGLLQNLQRTAREHHGAAAFTHLAFSRQHHAGHPCLGQQQGGGQTDWPGPHHDHRQHPIDRWNSRRRVHLVVKI